MCTLPLYVRMYRFRAVSVFVTLWVILSPFSGLCGLSFSWHHLLFPVPILTFSSLTPHLLQPPFPTSTLFLSLPPTPLTYLPSSPYTSLHPKLSPVSLSSPPLSLLSPSLYPPSPCLHTQVMNLDSPSSPPSHAPDHLILMSPSLRDDEQHQCIRDSVKRLKKEQPSRRRSRCVIVAGKVDA